VKISKEGGTGTIAFTLPRADGRPSNIRYTAATGPAPSWTGEAPTFVEASFYPAAADLAGALEGEAGGLLATFLAAMDSMGRDPDGTRRLLDTLPPESFTQPLLMLSSTLATHNRSVPTKVARGRATRDLEAALAKDPKDVSALMLRAELALGDSQAASAQEALKTALEIAGPESYPLQMLRARAAIALEVDAEAEEALSAALKALPGVARAAGVASSSPRQRSSSATPATTNGAPATR